MQSNGIDLGNFGVLNINQEKALLIVVCRIIWISITTKQHKSKFKQNRYFITRFKFHLTWPIVYEKLDLFLWMKNQ